jgi:hypothetical protein
MTGWFEQLETQGFALLRAVLAPNDVRAAIADWDEVCRRNTADEAILSNNGPAYGARNLLQLWPGAANFIRYPRLREPLRDVLGPASGVVRVLFFDKPPGHSWALPWHKDYTIAVARHGIEGAFSKPTTKAGVPHVIAPFELLNRMLSVRIHLDDMNDENGPLRVLAGSHRAYRQGEDGQSEVAAIHCQAGDVLLMRPLLTHASGHRTITAAHRRIVHLECAPEPGLPDGYEWHDFIPIE